MARLRATYSWRKEEGKPDENAKSGEKERGRVRDSGLISHQKHIKTTTTCRVTVAAIDLWTKRAALLQPKKRQIHMESSRKRGKVTWSGHNGDTEDAGISGAWESSLGSEVFKSLQPWHPTLRR